MANVVQNAIIATLHPRTLIEIVVQVLHNDGCVYALLLPPPSIVHTFLQSCFSHTCLLHTMCAFFFQMLAAAINATCLALVDAGIPLKYRPAHPTLDFALELLCLTQFTRPPARPQCRSWIASVTCAIAQNGVFVLDPDLAEESVELSLLQHSPHLPSLRCRSLTSSVRHLVLFCFVLLCAEPGGASGPVVCVQQPERRGGGESQRRGAAKERGRGRGVLPHVSRRRPSVRLHPLLLLRRSQQGPLPTPPLTSLLHKRIQKYKNRITKYSTEG